MNLIRKLYDKVIIDDYIQPLTIEYVSAVLTSTRRKRKQSKQKILKQQSSEPNFPQFVSSQQSIEQIPNVNDNEIQRTFRKLPKNYQIQDLHKIQIQLVQKLRIVNKIIVAKSPTYLQTIDQFLVQLQQVAHDTKIAKPKVSDLKQNLKKLQMTRAKSEKIVNLRIKKNNIKILSNYIKRLPNLNILKLSQLKTISLQSQLKSLKCYQHIDDFIRNKSAVIYSQVIEMLDQIMQKFDEKKYRGIINKYIELQVDTSLDELIFSVLTRNIRRFDLTHVELCKMYVNYMTNFFQIYLFHKNNEDFIEIKDKMFNLCPKIWAVMEEHLVEVIRESIGLSAIEIFELSCHVNRLIEIGQGFRGVKVQEEISDNIKKHASKVGEELQKKQTIIFISSFNKYLVSIGQSLNMEQSNQWSRLPVDNSYRHQGLNNLIANFINRSQNSVYKKLVTNNFYFLRRIRNQIKMPSINQTWQILNYTVDNTPLSDYKIKSLKLISTSLSQFKISKDVIISQSILLYMKFYEQMSQYVFSLRLVTEKILTFMVFLTNFYIYFVFMTFAPSDIKNLIFSQASAGAGLKQVYQRAKLNSKYPNLIKFINTFQKQFSKNQFDKTIKISESKLQESLVRARVVALESFEFLYKYLQFCLTNLKNLIPDVEKVWQKIQKRFNDYPLIQRQLSELLYSECIYKLTNIEPLLSSLWKMSWQDQNQSLQTLQQSKITLELYMKDFFKRLEAIGKGQIPLSSIQQIYIVFCKYISRFLQNKIVRLQKMTPQGKQQFIKMLQSLQNQISNYQNSPNFNFTSDIIQLIKITKSSEWSQIQQYIKESINKCNLSYTGLQALATQSRTPQPLGKNKKEQRVRFVQQYVKKIHG